jgi:hypothetical protein
MINSRYEGACSDIDHILNVLSKNGYKKSKLERHAAHVVNKLYCNDQNITNNDYEKDDRISLVVPYSNGFSKLKNSFRRLNSHNDRKSCNVNLISQSYKIFQLFSPKCKTPPGLKANLVYHFNCHGCNAQYIGETCRHLRTRFAEHSQASRNSHIFDHNILCTKRTSKLSLEEFKIIRTNFYSSCERIMYESFSIMCKKPILNVQNDFSDNIKIFNIVPN